ncbi:MAG: DUF2807 domain-containing protein, partial [Ferruginibacter sp.]|nr:DUF2807 domain-containing protein [Ferruginibacter sp.]
ATLLLTVQMAFCQMGALKGSGKIVTKTFAYQDFDRLQLNDLDGSVEVEVGKPYSIKVSIDDNLESLLNVFENSKILIVSISKNENNKRYIENSNIKIVISIPVLNEVIHHGNSDAIITGLKNHNFSAKSTGNGNLILMGTADNIEIEKAGNGNVDAAKLIVKNAKIVSVGNGDVKVNANDIFTADGTGNGDIINKGKAKPSANSKQKGNGEIISN